MAFDIYKPTFIFPLWVPLGTLELLPVVEIPKVELGTVLTAENGRQYIYTQINIPAATAAMPKGSFWLVSEDGTTADLSSTAAGNGINIINTPATGGTSTDPATSFYCPLLLSLTLGFRAK